MRSLSYLSPARWPGRLSSILPLLTLVLAGAFPAVAQTELPGLTTEARVIYDANAVPHVCTGSDRDAFFMEGYLHAQDRFFQMDTLRRTFSGTLAELLGPAALASDVQLRTFGLRRAAEESLAAYTADGLSDLLTQLDAYSRGVNAWLASHPLPPEYGALEITHAAPWTAVDSLTIGKGLAFGLSFDLIELDLTVLATVYPQAGAQAGFDGQALFFEDVVRVAPFDDRVSIPSAAPLQAAAGTSAAKAASPVVSPRAAELARRYRERVADVPLLERALKPQSHDKGSNWWLIGGSRSASGFPMLANDPHLALDTPATFYEIHLVSSAAADCGLILDGVAAEGEPLLFTGDDAAAAAPADKATGLNANGVSFAGAPGLVQGCNTRICWGSTVNPMDVTDVYVEQLVIDPATGVPVATVFDGENEPLVLIPQTFHVNQIGDQTPDNLADAGVGPLEGGLTLVVPRRNHGPIIQVDASELPVTALSVQYTGWRATYELEAFRRWLKAGNLTQFVDGLQYFDVGSQNFGYADVAGNIAYFTSAEMPLREDLQNLGFPDGGIPPFFIRDGTHTLHHEWLPLEDPQPGQALAYQILPFAEMPQTVNPASGWVANANNDPIGNTLDNNPLNEVRPGGGVFYLSPGYDSLRIGRISRALEALLANGHKATMAELQQIQANNQLLDAELIAPFLVAAFANAQDPGAPAGLQALAQDPAVAEAAGRIAEWDFSTPTGITPGYDPGDDPDNLPAPSAEEVADSVAATIWSVFRGQLVRRVVDQTLAGVGLGDFLPDSDSAYIAVAHLLETFDQGQGVGASGIDFFQAGSGLTPAEERDLILLESLRAALDLLASDTFAAAFHNSTDQDDYRWGYLHRIVFDHLLGEPFSVPPAGGFSHLSPELRGVARAGGYKAVDASSHSARADGVDEFMFGSGPARRFVGVLDPAGITAAEIIPGGQSGVLGSPHYASQLGRWLTNHYHPLSLDLADALADAIAQQQFDPTCLPDQTALCLQNGRFRVEANWSAPAFGEGPAGAVPGASELSGNLYFFDPRNWEVLVKVLDGCNLNGHYWVYASGATDLGWDLVVEDTFTGLVWITSNPLGQPSYAITDTEAFATCP